VNNSQPEKYLSPKQTRMYEDILKGISNNLKSSNYKENISNSWNWAS
jgi:hypothetical protein